MSLQRDEVIAKIQKLLTLSEGAKKIDSLEEANTAAMKAQSLIEAYNVEQYELHKSEKLVIGEVLLKSDDFDFNKREGKWVINLMNLLANNNFAFMFTIGLTYAMKIVGTKENCDLTIFMFLQIKERFKSLEKQRWAEYGGKEKHGTFRRGYFNGAVSGLYVKLQQQKVKSQSENTLLPVVIKSHKEEIQKYVDNSKVKLKDTNNSRKLTSEDGSVIGYRDGKNTEIHKGINPNPKQDALHH